MNKYNPYQIIFSFIREFSFVRSYQGKLNHYSYAAVSTKQHITRSFWMAVLLPLLGFYSVWLLWIYVIAFFLYAPLMEMWFQYKKEKSTPLSNILAQIFERGAAFALMAWWPGVVYLVRRFL